MTMIARPSEWAWPGSGPPKGAVPEQRQPLYFAFISYSHADEAAASWLHESLERFRVPKFLVGKLTEQGAIPARLTPIFRDLKELPAAGDLGNEIRSALAHSRCLIVLCSPTAATSKWTNREIEAFRRAHPDGCLLAAVLSGKPFASEIPGEEQLECLPPALRVAYDKRGRPMKKRAEPLCADLRGGSEDRRLGFLKLVAGILGIGLDDLVQRDTIRRHRRMAAVAAASMLGMLVTTGLAVTAIQAGNAAQEQRREAEGLVGFMLGDLRDKLEPLGRLDVLDSVAQRALSYYERSDSSDLSDDALAQRSRALTLMGEIANSRGDLGTAVRLYEQAYEETREALARKPGDPQRMFDHAQNIFWIGYIDWQRGNLNRAEAAFRTYDRMARQMVATEPTNTKWLLERAYANNGLGVVRLDRALYDEASDAFREALRVSEGLAAISPANSAFQNQLVQSIAWLAEAREKAGALDEALALRSRQLSVVTDFRNRRPDDAELKLSLMVAHRKLAGVQASKGQLPGALANLRSARLLGDQLVRLDPQNSEWAQFVAQVHFDNSQLLLASGRRDEGVDQLNSGCRIAGRLRSRDPSVLSWRTELPSRCLRGRARLMLMDGKGEEARSYADELIDLARSEQSRRRLPENDLLLAEGELLRGEALNSMGDREDAASAWRTASNLWRRDVRLTPTQMAIGVMVLNRNGSIRESANMTRRLNGIGFRHPAYRVT